MAEDEHVDEPRRPSQFFDVEAELPCRTMDLHRYLVRRLHTHIAGMAKEGLYENAGGYLSIVSRELQKPIFGQALGNPDEWAYPYDQIVEEKLEVQYLLPLGVNTRVAQLVHTTYLRASDTVFFGSYAEEDIAVGYSGEKDFLDEAICRVMFGYYKAYIDFRVNLLKQVCDVLDFGHYSEAMTAIELYAHQSGLTQLEPVVKQLVAVKRIDQARTAAEELVERGMDLDTEIAVLNTIAVAAAF